MEGVAGLGWQFSEHSYSQMLPQKGTDMFVLVAALLLLGVLLGAVAHLPLPLSLAAAGLIGLWLTLFGVRERRARRAR